MVQLSGERALGFNTTVAQLPEHPQRPGPRRRFILYARNQHIDALHAFRQVVHGELDFHGWRQVHYAIDRPDWPPHDVPQMKMRHVGES